MQELIVKILEDVLDVAHDDKTNRIEMLRKIENEVRFMSEKRDHFAAFSKLPRSDPIDKLENEQDKTRKDKRLKKNREIEEKEMRERERRNEEKKEK